MISEKRVQDLSQRFREVLPPDVAGSLNGGCRAVSGAISKKRLAMRNALENCLVPCSKLLFFQRAAPIREKYLKLNHIIPRLRFRAARYSLTKPNLRAMLKAGAVLIRSSVSNQIALRTRWVPCRSIFPFEMQRVGIHH